jgi:hypothetical protein
VNRFSPRSFTASLSYYVTDSETFPTFACIGCRSFLDIHQPDPNHPVQFLGTCPRCGRWCRLVFSKDEAELVVIELPDAHQIEANPPPRDDGKA